MTNNDDINKKFNEASETDETGTYSETDTKNLEDIYNNSLILRANNDLALYIQNQIKVYNEPISEQLKSIDKKFDDAKKSNGKVLCVLAGIILSGIGVYFKDIFPVLSKIDTIKEKTESIEKTVEKIQDDKQNFEHRLTRNEKDFEYLTKRK